MKSEKIKLSLNIRQHKIGKFLHLFARESIEDFQNSSYREVQDLLSSLKNGDASVATTNVEHYIKTLKNHLEDLEQISSLIEKDLSKNLLPSEEGEAEMYTNTNGGVTWTIYDDKPAKFGTPKSSADAEVLEDLSDLEEDSLGVDGGGE
jgi:bisphosphoglycerate-independent phosphoglycerate mutase (AlkP superfamily)